MQYIYHDKVWNSNLDNSNIFFTGLGGDSLTQTIQESNQFFNWRHDNKELMRLTANGELSLEILSASNINAFSNYVNLQYAPSNTLSNYLLGSAFVSYSNFANLQYAPSNVLSNYFNNTSFSSYSNFVNTQYVLSNQQSNFVLSDTFTTYSNNVNARYVLSNQQSNFVLSNTFSSYSNFVDTQYANSNTFATNSNALWTTLIATSNVAFPDRYWTINTSNVFTNSNVGIGTNTPQETLQVVGNVLCSNLLQRTAGDYIGNGWRWNGSTWSNYTTQGGFVLRNGGLGTFELYTGSNTLTRQMVCLPNGNFGINTNTPNFNLDINGSMNVASNINTSNIFVSNRIGIGGVPTPLAPIHLSNNPGNTRQLLLFSLSNNDNECFSLGVDTSNTSNLLRYQSCYGDHIFSVSQTATSSFDIMRVRSSGRVDITSNSLFVAGTPVVFGRNYFYGENLVTTSVANNTYSTKVTITQNFEAGNFMIMCYTELSITVAARFAQMSITLDGVEINVNESTTTNTAQWVSSQTMHKSTLTAGSHTIIMRFRRATFGTQTGTVNCRNTKLAIWRVE